MQEKFWKSDKKKNKNICPKIILSVDFALARELIQNLKI